MRGLRNVISSDHPLSPRLAPRPAPVNLTDRVAAQVNSAPFLYFRPVVSSGGVVHTSTNLRPVAGGKPVVMAAARQQGIPAAAAWPEAVCGINPGEVTGSDSFSLSSWSAPLVLRENLSWDLRERAATCNKAQGTDGT